VRGCSRIDNRSLPGTAPHAAHPVKEALGEAAIAEQVIVEEVDVPSRQPFDLGQCLVARWA
jgi:hypothetical protein